MGFLKKYGYPIALAVVFIWIGFVCSISFMEAWLKFQAPLVSRPIGLSIGRLVFDALNKVEWTFAAVTVAVIFLKGVHGRLKEVAFLFLPISILLVQTFLLLPALNERVETILQGVDPLPSYVHFYYFGLEIVKVTSLFALGICMTRYLRTYPDKSFD